MAIFNSYVKLPKGNFKVFAAIDWTSIGRRFGPQIWTAIFGWFKLAKLKKCCCNFLNCSFTIHLKAFPRCFSTFFHLFVPICSCNPDEFEPNFFPEATNRGCGWYSSLVVSLQLGEIWICGFGTNRNGDWNYCNAQTIGANHQYLISKSRRNIGIYDATCVYKLNLLGFNATNMVLQDISNMFIAAAIQNWGTIKIIKSRASEVWEWSIDVNPA